ncbi:sulfurtransferase TusA family protein [Aquimarina sp. RZ0]|uniref:sulfurtransferase TusA family protein n=1 Tax=Aquimarina sp. RZ0 TaxID=2607730 RepID=UPI0011F0BA2D|nr:sulfurtransferase TusA family protein [Aquimarina sp. RZ0]KAA1243147.1 sulfurtransferase TusA family protein [Aquimarina sp. RZ0]
MLENTLDVTGKKCPIPLMKAKKELKNMNSGDILKVIATDPNTQQDFKKFCLRGKYKLIDFLKQSENYIYHIEKT